MDERCNSQTQLVNPTEGSEKSFTSSMTNSYGSFKEVDVSSVSVASSNSSGFRRTQNAAEKLNRELLFGESEPPEDLDEDWSYVSDKNAHKRQFNPTSDMKTLIHLLKGNIGAGLLALPYAVSMSGYLIGPVVLLIFGLISMHCMVLLVKAAKELCRTNGFTALDYSEVMQFAILRFYSQKKRKHAKAGKLIVNIFLVITQFGFCAVYLVVMAVNLQQVLDEAFGLDLSEKALIAILFLPVVIFSWIRDLDQLSYYSMMANLALLFSLVVIFYDEIYRLISTEPTYTAQIKTSVLPLARGPIFVATFLGSAVYAFEGIGVVLPLENKMQYPEHAPRVVYIGMSMVTGLFVMFGLMGYLVYGDLTQASITLNLCATNVAYKLFFLLAKLFIAFALFCSYLLQFYVPLDFIEPLVFRKFKLDFLTYNCPRYHGFLQSLAYCSLRTVLVLLTACLALSLPDLGDLITLVGALASSCLVFVFPPLINILTFSKPGSSKKSSLRRMLSICKDVCIIAVGIAGCALGTYAAINNLVGYFEHTPEDFYCPTN